MTVPATNPNFKESINMSEAKPYHGAGVVQSQAYYSGTTPLATASTTDVPMAEAVPIYQGTTFSEEPNISNDEPSKKQCGTNRPPVQAQATTTTTTTKIQYVKLGRKPTRVLCPHCNYDGVTRTTKEISGLGALSSGAMCFIFWPLFWVPLIMSDCQTVKHKCAQCGCKISSVSPCV